MTILNIVTRFDLLRMLYLVGGWAKGGIARGPPSCKTYWRPSITSNQIKQHFDLLHFTLIWLYVAVGERPKAVPRQNTLRLIMSSVGGRRPPMWKNDVRWCEWCVMVYWWAAEGRPCAWTTRDCMNGVMVQWRAAKLRPHASIVNPHPWRPLKWWAAEGHPKCNGVLSGSRWLHWWQQRFSSIGLGFRDLTSPSRWARLGGPRVEMVGGRRPP